MLNILNISRTFYRDSNARVANLPVRATDAITPMYDSTFKTNHFTTYNVNKIPDN